MTSNRDLGGGHMSLWARADRAGWGVVVGAVYSEV